jgi:hypothetical protein
MKSFLRASSYVQVIRADDQMMVRNRDVDGARTHTLIGACRHNFHRRLELDQFFQYASAARSGVDCHRDCGGKVHWQLAHDGEQGGEAASRSSDDDDVSAHPRMFCLMREGCPYRKVSVGFPERPVSRAGAVHEVAECLMGLPCPP